MSDADSSKRWRKNARTNGAFASFEDFCDRMYPKELNRRALEGLVKSGAFDSLGYRRSQLLQIYDAVLNDVASATKKNIAGQIDLFGLGEEEKKENIHIPNVPELPKRDLLSMEKETTDCICPVIRWMITEISLQGRIARRFVRLQKICRAIGSVSNRSSIVMGCTWFSRQLSQRCA